MTFTTNKIFIAYGTGHVDKALSQAERGTIILCLDFLTEREFKKKNIPFISLRDFVDSETEEEWWALAHEIAREWYRLPAMKFFEYDGIRIAEAPEPIMEAYLARLFYYVRIYTVLKEAYPDAHLYIPAPPILKDMSSVVCLTPLMRWAIIDAARIVGLPSTVNGKRVVPEMYSFPGATWRSLFLRVYNVIIGFIPRRNFKIYASEYWTHLAPSIPYMNDTELILMESRGLMKIPWWHILKHRIRIRYPNGEISDAEKHAAMRISEKFVEQWKVAKKEVAKYLASVRAGLDWSPVLEACEYLMTYAPRVIVDINMLRRIMKEEKPDVVLQMASVGGPQHYFFLMARVAAQLKIPSLELQHAGATIDPRSVYCRIETDYLATYGADVNAWHERLGHARSRLISVGSPRFDKYINERVQGFEKGKQLFKQLGLDTSRPVLLAAVPFSDTFASALDSYQLAEFFEMIHEARNNVPGLQVLFKCRTGRDVGITREYIQELFQTDSAVSGDEDIHALLCASDAVVCSNSTVIYQAVLAGKPLVLCSWKSFDTYHAQVYELAAPLFYVTQEAVDSIVRIFSDPSYREELLARQQQFLKGYSFDGKSSERVAALPRDLSWNNRQ